MSERKPIRIRPAIEEDVPALLAMVRALAADEGRAEAITATEADWLRDGFGTQPRFATLVAEADGRAVAMASFTELYLAIVAKPSFYILELYVEPDFRRRGIGRALLSQIAAAALKIGVPLIHLGARENNDATRFYRRLGFNKVERYATYTLTGPAFVKLAATAPQGKAG